MPARLTKEQFVSKANHIHSDLYVYSEVEYKNNSTKVKIICPQHGVFEQTPSDHLSGYGCNLCGRSRTTSSCRNKIEDVVIQAQKVHGQKYNYEMVQYKNVHTKIEIICPSHGSFWQTPNNHIRGQQGCPRCNESKGERKIRLWLEKHAISFEQEKSFDGCINPVSGRKLRFDFYLPEHNLCIEFDGQQHFRENVGSIVGKGHYKFTLRDWYNLSLLDDIKNQWCLFNSKKLLRIAYHQTTQIEELLKSEV